MAVLVFALVAGLSPIAVVSTLAVLTSRRGRTNGVAFATGFMLAQAAGFLSPSSSARRRRHHRREPARRAALELAFGVALLAIAWPQRKNRKGRRGGRSRTKALLDRLRGLRPVTAFTSGAHARRGRQAAHDHARGRGDRRRRQSGPRRTSRAAIVYLARRRPARLAPGLRLRRRRCSGRGLDRGRRGSGSPAHQRRLVFFSTVVFGLLLSERCCGEALVSVVLSAYRGAPWTR